MTVKLDWANPNLVQEFVDMRKAQKSYREIVDFIYAKYGISFTQARMSQLNKRFKSEGLL